MSDPTPVTLDVRHYQRMLACSSNGRRKYLHRLQGFEIKNAKKKVIIGDDENAQCTKC